MSPLEVVEALRKHISTLGSGTAYIGNSQVLLDNSHVLLDYPLYPIPGPDRFQWLITKDG